MVRMPVKNLKKDKSQKYVTGLSIIIIFAVLVLIVKVFIFSIMLVEGTSMTPTLENGDIVPVYKLAYAEKEPQIDDIVIAIEPITNKHVIKRIVGVPGMPVTYQEKTLYLQEDEYFIKGDNTDASVDSRNYGPIKVDRIIGKVLV